MKRNGNASSITRSIDSRMAGKSLVLACFALALLGPNATPVSGQDFRHFSSGYPRPQSPVDSASRHLEMLAHRSGGYASGKERERYDNALRHLSEFQNRFYQGHFEKGRLDRAINDMQNIVNHNALDERGRSILWSDLNNLRTFRSTHGQEGQFMR